MDLLLEAPAKKAAMLAEVTLMKLEVRLKEAAMQVKSAPMKLAVATTEIPRRIQAVRKAPQLVLKAEALGSASRP